MRREANIPLFLWITTAVVVHLLWSGGADQGAKILEQRLDIQRFARAVQSHVRGVGVPIEIALQEDEKDEEAKPIEKDEPDPPTPSNRQNSRTPRRTTQRPSRSRPKRKW